MRSFQSMIGVRVSHRLTLIFCWGSQLFALRLALSRCSRFHFPIRKLDCFCQEIGLYLPNIQNSYQAVDWQNLDVLFIPATL